MISLNALRMPEGEEITNPSHLTKAIQDAFEELGADIPAEIVFRALGEVIRKEIAAGAASLRAGKGVDGEDFFGHMLSDLDVRARQTPA
jgi:hypothetical protein